MINMQLLRNPVVVRIFRSFFEGYTGGSSILVCAFAIVIKTGSASGIAVSGSYHGLSCTYHQL